MNQTAQEFALTSPTDHEAAFLEAWKRAITMTGAPGLFSARGAHLRDIHSRDKLRPVIREINSKIHLGSKSQGAFIAGLVAFYNPEEGARLAKKVGVNGIGDLALNLSDEQRHIVAELLINHTRW